MSTPSPASAHVAGPAPVTEDLGPLAWVLGEIQKSLDNACRTLRRFARDAAGAAEPDVAPLRLARQQLHQAVGALQMVAHPAPALVLGAMEFAVQSFIEQPASCSEAVVGKIDRAGFAVTDFLQAMLAGKAVSSVALFPQYRDVLELVGNERIHPADLWSVTWRWVEIKPAPTQPALVYDPAVRARLDREVLQFVKSGDDHAARRLQALCLGLGRGAVMPRVASFWTLAAGFFEALALALIPSDAHVKRAASRVLMQYATLARGDNTVSDRLGQDLLFFCAQAAPDRRDEAATLRAVRAAWGVTDEQGVDYTIEQFGRFDPNVLGQARKRIEAAKEMWSALSGGDVSRTRQVADTFAQLGESLVRLHPPSQPLVQALNNAVDASLRSGQPPVTELAMEVATAVLYLEAAFEDLDPHDRQLTARTVQLAGRVERVRDGGRSEPLEPWMEELYRRVSDRQTMGTVVDELRSHLGELEKALDQFFRHPADMSLLRGVPSQLMQMRGVFSVLGLDQAARTVQRMRESVEHLLTGASPAASARDVDALGNNLGALGFLVDMLGYQPALAKRLFVFDDEAGELKPLMGRQGADAATGGVPATLASASGAVPAASTLSVEEVDAQIAARLAALAAPSRKVASPIEEFDRAATSWTARITGPAPLEPLPDTEVRELEEDDLQNIFLDEAREVLHNGLAAVAALRGQADDDGALTVLRRAFHTLKGSSRMVGLMDFGDAAWAFEQVLNTWLADQRQATPELLSTADRALQDFAKWVAAVADGELHGWQAAPFRSMAEALLKGEPVAAPQRTADADALAVAARHIAADAAPAAPIALPELPDLDLPPRGFEPTRFDGPAPVPGEGAKVDFDDGFASTDFLDFDGQPMSPVDEPAMPTELEDIDFLETAHLSFEPTSQPTQRHAPAEPPASEAPSDIPLEPVYEPLPALLLEPEAQPGEEPEVQTGSKVEEQSEGQSEEKSKETTEEAAEEPVGAAPELPQEDFDTFMRALEAGSMAPAPVTDVATPQPFDWDLDLELTADAADVKGPPPAPEFESEPEIDAEARSAPEPEPEAEAEAEAASEATVSSEPASWAPAAGGAEEQVKVIGPLRIGIALYNVYLVEADEWSRQLVDEVGEWALEPHTEVADSTIAAAHSLAGSSATVGFQGLSGMARLFEAALQHLQRQGRGTSAQGAALMSAADELRRLLHQFAAGFLKEPSAATLQTLRDVAASPMPVELGGASTSAAPSPQPARGVEAEVALDDDADGTFDVEDAVDIDLFPIFEEEATELLPGLGAALRQWMHHPADAAPRAAVLRTLHTLKGSARLAGAMRLGELAHRMESEIEALGVDEAGREPIEPLLARFDALQANFDALRADDEARQAELARRAAAAPEAARTSEPPAAAHAEPPFAAPVRQSAPAVVAALEAVDADVNADVDAARAATAAPAPDAPTAARPGVALPVPSALTPLRAASGHAVRIRTPLLDRLVAQAGEIIITRSRLEAEIGQLRSSLADLTSNLDRLRQQLRDIEVQAESQMQSRLAQAKDSQQGFDPLEFDRFTRVQELTRMMAESVNDVATVQRTLQRTVQATEDDLSAQARQTRELQRGLLRTRMVEFEGIAERLYRVVRQASKDTGKQVRLDIVGGGIEMDRGVLDRMTPAFEHLLRNCVAHGIEDAAVRERAGKEPGGLIVIELHQEGNDVSVSFSDDGAGLDRARIVARALALGLIEPDRQPADDEAFELIFRSGFSTADQVSELSGRGIGMDVVRAEVAALGGRIETRSEAGRGTRFRLVLPLTTAVTHVVMLRAGEMSVGVPSSLVELVQRTSTADLEAAYRSQRHAYAGEQVPFYWAGALLQSSARSERPAGKTHTVVIVRSAAQRVALHVDEVLGNQEVVVKNLGPQLSHLPGMAAISVLASGAVALIYNPVALAAVHGDAASALQASVVTSTGEAAAGVPADAVQAGAQLPLVLVVDDSITVRRVTQRLLLREGYRVALAVDGLQALERLQQERPAVVLSDIEMPRMDGFDLARNIRADAALAKLPIIMITSRIAEKHHEHARMLGVNHYLGKPYAEDELLRLVRRYAHAESPERFAA